MIEIRSLDGLSFDELYNSFRLAFADYPIAFDKEDLCKMLVRRGFDAKLSFGAFDGDKLISFTFNGIGIFDSKPMAYDIGTGTATEYRGQGWAGLIFRHTLPYLQSQNISHYILEVLQENKPAIAVYTKQGFDITRELNCYTIDGESQFLNTNNKPFEIDIKPTELTACIATHYHDFTPSWQNSFASIERAAHNFVILGAYTDCKLVGYCVFDPKAGDITQLAVSKQYRRQGIGTRLLQSALLQNENKKAKILNIDTRCQSLIAFLNRLPISNKQYEMIREI